MRARLTVASLLVCAGLAACGATNTAQTVPRAASATRATPRTPTAAPAAPTATAATTTPAASVSTPETVTTATITAPDSGGAPIGGLGGVEATQTATLTTATATHECIAGDLKTVAVPPNSAPGTTVLGFELTNRSAGACASGGFPGIGLIDAAGGVDAVSTTRVTRDALGATPVRSLTLAPGQTMSFRITLRDSGADCGSYTGAQIIAPNDTATLRVTIPDGPVQSCGSVDVSAVEPGSSATGQ
jgi:hypothetical protein